MVVFVCLYVLVGLLDSFGWLVWYVKATVRIA